MLVSLGLARLVSQLPLLMGKLRSPFMVNYILSIQLLPTTMLYKVMGFAVAKSLYDSHVMPIRKYSKSTQSRLFHTRHPPLSVLQPTCNIPCRLPNNTSFFAKIPATLHVILDTSSWPHHKYTMIIPASLF
jgi:hypothetical protein